MGSFTTVKAADGHELKTYVAMPEGTPVGGVVVVQEIFGVNESIRSVADSYAQDGFVAVAPAIFDRYERDIDLTYTGDDLKKAFELYGRLQLDTTLLDVAAAFGEAKSKSGGKGVAVLGFCYGGLTSWAAAARAKTVGIAPACTVGYYAGGVGNIAKEELSCPVLLHFGGADTHIGPDQIEAVRTAHPDVEIHRYDGAGHGFANAWRAEYNPEAAKLARERSLAFLKKHIA